VTQLILKRASASRSSGEWNDDDYDVLADGVVVGRIMKAAAAPEGTPWLWTLAYGQHKDRTPTHGYEQHASSDEDAWLHEIEHDDFRAVSVTSGPAFSNRLVYSPRVLPVGQMSRRS
jgi:hypothetical protein